MLMGTIVVHHEMKFYRDRELGIQAFQELEELLMAVPGITLPCATSSAANRVVVPLRL
jgi:hypothetical protein